LPPAGALAAGLDALARGDAVAAEQQFRACLASDGDAPDALHGLGKALLDQAGLAEAEAAFAAALRIEGPGGRAAYHLGLLRLLQGDHAAGWPGWEARGAVLGFPRLAAPLWDGTPMGPGSRLLILGEQGFGDVIQFARLLPAAARRCGAAVTFGCAPPLQALLEPFCRAQGIACVTGRVDPARFDRALWLCSLPALLGSAPIVATSAYLEAPPAQVATWRRRRPAGLRCIGVVWEGRASHPQDAQRSLKPEALAPLAALPGTLLVGMQRPPLRRAPPQGLLAMDWGADVEGFDAAAAMLAALDGLVTVDTALAHLAGALGLPAVVLLPHVPDWRWGMTGEATPWYPSLRLARQPAPGDWAGALARALRLLAA
jgi:hypothetical protein